jgi:hypothetical protein
MYAYFSRKDQTVAEQFLQELIKNYEKNPVSTDDDGSTWYPQASRFLKLRHHTHSLILLRKKSIIIENELFNI